MTGNATPSRTAHDDKTAGNALRQDGENARHLERDAPVHAIRSQRIVFLDLLRIFAFLSVLAGHKYARVLAQVIQDDTVHASARWLAKVTLPFVYGGACGVVVFFLVSGYVIAYVLQSEKAGEFLIKRFFRIYPLYVSAVLVWAVYRHFSLGAVIEPATVLLQMSLLGDFSGTALALDGVEWTLRIEVMFYLFMAAFRGMGLLTQTRRYLFAVVLALMLLLIGLSPPFPQTNDFRFAYLTLYAPFLFVGVAFFLAEIGRISKPVLCLMIGATLLQHWMLIAKYQPKWLTSHFALLACTVFALAWLARSKLKWSAAGVLLSNLTYSVYLFHNWLYDYFLGKVALFSFNGLAKHLAALVALFVFCWIMFQTVERGGIRLGGWVRRRLQSHHLTNVRLAVSNAR